MGQQRILASDIWDLIFKVSARECSKKILQKIPEIISEPHGHLSEKRNC